MHLFQNFQHQKAVDKHAEQHSIDFPPPESTAKSEDKEAEAQSSKCRSYLMTTNLNIN
jgi:hypothetical protein